MSAQELVGVAEIAEMLGVTRQRVNRIVQTSADFPKPVADLSAGRIWRLKDIQIWIKKHPQRRPGRPKGGGRL